MTAEQFALLNPTKLAAQGGDSMIPEQFALLNSTASTHGVNPMTPLGGNVMTREQFDREASYRAALALAKDWLRQGWITEREYVRIDTIMAKKFSPVWGAIPSVSGSKRQRIA